MLTCWALRPAALVEDTMDEILGEMQSFKEGCRKGNVKLRQTVWQVSLITLKL